MPKLHISLLLVLLLQTTPLLFAQVETDSSDLEPNPNLNNTSIVTPNTTNLLPGSWYGYQPNPFELGCCMPSGDVKISYLNESAIYVQASDWIGLDCSLSPNYTKVIPLNGSSSYTELEEVYNFSNEDNLPEDSDGFKYIVAGLNYTYAWTSNQTQAVVLSVKMDNGNPRPCSFELSMSNATIHSHLGGHSGLHGMLVMRKTELFSLIMGTLFAVMALFN